MTSIEPRASNPLSKRLLNFLAEEGLTLYLPAKKKPGSASTQDGFDPSPPLRRDSFLGASPYSGFLLRESSRAAGDERKGESPRAKALEELRFNIGDCTRCPLCQGRTQLVFGEGNPEAELMFVGEGPGVEEDLQGKPFVGAAGQLLTRMIEAMKFQRHEVYIANVVKCRPPQNREPRPEEVSQCLPFLKRQIAIIKPRVIVTLGKCATQALLQSTVPISKLRGRWQKYEDPQGPHPTPLLMPTYHPAYLLRNPGEKRVVWKDLKKVMEFLKK